MAKKEQGNCAIPHLGEIVEAVERHANETDETVYGKVVAVVTRKTAKFPDEITYELSGGHEVDATDIKRIIGK